MTDVIVTIEEGRLKGTSARDYFGGTFYSFLGIPYAKAPIGELRFKAPVPVEPWEGIKDATKEGPECPSLHMFFAYQIGAEDNCLNLNVYTKELPNNDKPVQRKPVMVWIHGGAFLYGCNKKELFGPDYLMSEDIVLVVINYRLGALGFLSLEDPSLGVPGNAGLKDMVMALKWVQRNISKFNGDPKNVTIFGESAGGASVHHLYLSPMAKGLFHKVIAQSGCALNIWALGKHNGKDLAKFMGCKETDEKKILEHLKDSSVQKLIKAQHKSPDNFAANFVRPFGPVVENTNSKEEAFMPEPPIEILKKGTFNQVPIMMGYTSKEGIFFEIVRKLKPEAKINSDFENEIPYDLNSGNPKEVANKIHKFYFGDEKPSEKNIDKVFLMKSDNQFIHGIHRAISFQKNSSTQPIYLYRMSLETSINYYKRICTAKSVHTLFMCYYLSYKALMGKNLFLKLSKSVPNSSNCPSGACHADDLGYLFTSFLTQKVDSGSLEETSIKRFVKLWTNFAKTGNPTPDKDELLNNVEWKAVDGETHNFLDIGKELKAGTNPDQERMQFWDSIYS